MKLTILKVELTFLVYTVRRPVSIDIVNIWSSRDANWSYCHAVESMHLKGTGPFE